MSSSRAVRPPVIERVAAYLQDPDPSLFDRMARDVFAFQHEHNAPYRTLCDARGCGPDAVNGWADAPAVPTGAFKRARFATGEPVHVFHTSGTTADARGEHALPGLDLYEASWEPAFRRFVLPDGARLPLFSLVPRSADVPESSLSWMVTQARERFGALGSATFAAREGFRWDDLRAALRGAADSGQPVLLVGTALAFVELLDALDSPVLLPEGSRVMDTGGFKGRTREVSREDLLSAYRDRLGITPAHVVGEYGMTELCSQFYEPGLRETVEGLSPGARRYVGPPWVRTRVLDPDTLKECEPGRAGLLAHFDLANAWTVSSIVTEDVGLRVGDGFQLLGRAADAELRGCSLTTEEILRGIR